MTTPPPIEYADASPQVRAVYDDIKKTRNVADVNLEISCARPGNAQTHVGQCEASYGAGRA